MMVFLVFVVFAVYAVYGGISVGRWNLGSAWIHGCLGIGDEEATKYLSRYPFVWMRFACQLGFRRVNSGKTRDLGAWEHRIMPRP